MKDNELLNKLLHMENNKKIPNMIREVVDKCNEMRELIYEYSPLECLDESDHLQFRVLELIIKDRIIDCLGGLNKAYIWNAINGGSKREDEEYEY